MSAPELRPLLIALKLGGPRASVSWVRGPDARLPEVVRALESVSPQVWVRHTALELEAAPPGALALVGLDATSAQWLNERRDAITRVGLRLVLWTPRGTDLALRSVAPDLDSWVHTVVDLEVQPPSWTVERLRAAPVGRIRWEGTDLSRALEVAWPGLRSLSLRPGPSPEGDAASIGEAGFFVFQRIDNDIAARRARWILAAARRVGAVYDRPGRPTPGFAPVHDTPMPWGEAAARLRGAGLTDPDRLAVELGLEPEAVEARAGGEPGVGPEPDPLRALELCALEREPAELPALPEGPAVGPEAEVLLSVALRWPDRVDVKLTSRLIRLWSDAGEGLAVKGLAERNVARAQEGAERLEARFCLAEALYSAGERGAARALHEAVLAERISTLGEEHPDTLNSIYEVATYLTLPAELDRRRSLCARLLEVRQRTLGPDHKDTLEARWGLGLAHHHAGALHEARREYDAVLGALDRQPGADPASGAWVQRLLASTLQDLDLLTEARAEGEAAVAGLSRSLGVRHPDTLVAMATLANILRRSGALELTRSLEEQVLDTRLDLHGSGHPETVTAASNLGLTLADLGDLPRARDLLTQATERARALGDREVTVNLTPAGNLAYVLRKLWDLAGAISLLQDIYRDRLATSGADHPDTLLARANLAEVLYALGRLREAQVHQEAVWRASKARLGDDHADALVDAWNLVCTLDALGAPLPPDLQAPLDRLAAKPEAELTAITSRQVRAAWLARRGPGPLRAAQPPDST